ncbi:MAG TPA: hypothetical protein VK879_09340 [Candidatus Sulfomarinibacteraceae bacterium]|nr:hypothetical protein [Candidatus Sulfomarinibacteraceae bacterium]
MKQQSRFLSLAFAPIILIAILTAIFALAHAAPVAAQPPLCTPVKKIDNLQSETVLASRGFHVHDDGLGSVDFRGRGKAAVAELILAEDLSEQPNAARITEVDSSVPVDQRMRCWQPTERFDVVAEFEVRFDQPDTPPGVTETLFLWNAPLGEDSASTLTAFGVTRNQFFGGYSAVAAQNLDLATFAGHLELVPMSVDPTQWHSIRVTMSMAQVIIEAAQGGDYQTVLVSTPPGAIEPLAFEFSLDNEVFPGNFEPVSVPDTLEIESLSIRRVPAGE